jgi:transcriptional regulator with XRE-family HTH domain
MQRVERAEWASATAAAALFALPFAVSSGTGGHLQVVPFESTGNSVLISERHDDVAGDPQVRNIATRLSALLTSYGLTKTQLASVLSVSRPTLDGWLNQSVETIRQSNQERLDAIEQALLGFVPVRDAAYLGAYLQRKLENDSAKLLAALSAEVLDDQMLEQAFAPIAGALDGMRRSQELDKLLGENKAPFI